MPLHIPYLFVVGEENIRHIVNIACWRQLKYMRVMQSKFTKNNLQFFFFKQGRGGRAWCAGPESTFDRCSSPILRCESCNSSAIFHITHHLLFYKVFAIKWVGTPPPLILWSPVPSLYTCNPLIFLKSLSLIHFVKVWLPDFFFTKITSCKYVSRLLQKYTLQIYTLSKIMYTDIWSK